MAIEWGRDAWNEVSSSTIKKCFQTTGMYPQDPVLENGPFEGKELHDLQNLIDRFETSCIADEFIAAEDEIEICSGLIDSSNPNWRDDVRQDLLRGDEEGELSIAAEHEPGAEEENGEYDLDAKQPSIKTVRERLYNPEMRFEILPNLMDIKNSD